FVGARQRSLAGRDSGDGEAGVACGLDVALLLSQQAEMRWITCVQVRPNLRLYVEVQDGRTGEIDIFAFIGGLDELRDPALFAQVFVDDLGVLTWPNGQTI